MSKWTDVEMGCGALTVSQCRMTATNHRSTRSWPEHHLSEEYQENTFLFFYINESYFQLKHQSVHIVKIFQIQNGEYSVLFHLRFPSLQLSPPLSSYYHCLECTCRWKHRHVCWESVYLHKWGCCALTFSFKNIPRPN